MAQFDVSKEFRGSTFRTDLERTAWAHKRQEVALEPELPIIDPHHHLWEKDTGRYLIHELAEDVYSGHNIIATVFIECGQMRRVDGPAAMKPVGEVEFVNGAAAMSASGRYGKAKLCAGIIGHVNLTLGDEARAVLEAEIAAGNGRFRGIRHGVTWDSGNAAKFGRSQPPRHLVLDPTFRKGFAHLKPLGLSFESWQFHPQLDDTADLLRAFPDTNVILNHTGGVLGLTPHEDRAAAFKVWKKNMQNLVQFPHLSIKVGGLGMAYCGWDFHLREVPPTSEELAEAWRPYVETTIEMFGPARCMMESNFPVDKESTGYGVLWNAFKRITANYSAADKQALYRDTAARVYRLAV